MQCIKTGIVPNYPELLLSGSGRELQRRHATSKYHIRNQAVHPMLELEIREEKWSSESLKERTAWGRTLEGGEKGKRGRG